MRDIHKIRLANARELASQFPTRAAFAEKLQKEPTQISRFMGSNPTKAIGDIVASQIEVAMGKPNGWLDKDHSVVYSNTYSKQESSVAESNIRNEKGIPLISWIQAGSWSEVFDDFEPGYAKEYYPCPENHSVGTFALKVVGESMYPDFVPGEIIYVDPDVQSVNGSYVVVRQNDDSEVTFKKLIIEGSEKMLKAVNPDWPNPIMKMLPDAVICGVVIGSYRKRN